MDVIIVGAGGHGQVVADILLQRRANGIRPLGYLDDNHALHGRRFLNLPVLGATARLAEISHDAVIVAIGHNAIRRRVFGRLRKEGETFFTAIHPGAILAPDVVVGSGTMICAGVVVNTGSRIGKNVILNTGSTIDHHNQIGDHCHIAPGVHLGGEVTIHGESLIGIGATVMPRCQVGHHATVGAGALVTRDVDDGQTVAGVPARPLSS